MAITSDLDTPRKPLEQVREEAIAHKPSKEINKAFDNDEKKICKPVQAFEGEVFTTPTVLQNLKKA